MVDNAIPQNTKNATKNWMSVLNGYLKTRKIANNIDELLDCDLPRTLEIFYSEVTKDNSKKGTKKKAKSDENSNQNNNNDVPTTTKENWISL